MLAVRSLRMVNSSRDRKRFRCDHRHQSLESAITIKGDLSFSWYCRRPETDNVGAAVRIGDAMLGLATVRSICDGTAAATRLNMLTRGTCGVLRVCVLYSGRLRGICELRLIVVGELEMVTG